MLVTKSGYEVVIGVGLGSPKWLPNSSQFFGRPKRELFSPHVCQSFNSRLDTGSTDAAD